MQVTVRDPGSVSKACNGHSNRGVDPAFFIMVPFIT